MTDPFSHADATIPADDPTRKSTLARSDDPSLPHIGLVGDTYTILVAGKDTNGRYSLIDMHIPPGGGLPPHHHDLEEDVVCPGGRTRGYFPRKKDHHSSWRNPQHSSVRTSPIPKQERAIGATAMSVLAGRAGTTERQRLIESDEDAETVVSGLIELARTPDKKVVSDRVANALGRIISCLISFDRLVDRVEALEERQKKGRNAR